MHAAQAEFQVKFLLDGERVIDCTPTSLDRAFDRYFDRYLHHSTNLLTYIRSTDQLTNLFDRINIFVSIGYSCSLVTSRFLPGKLYVTERYVCFHSIAVSPVISHSIRLADVSALKRGRSMFMTSLIVCVPASTASSTSGTNVRFLNR